MCSEVNYHLLPSQAGTRQSGSRSYLQQTNQALWQSSWWTPPPKAESGICLPMTSTATKRASLSLVLPGNQPEPTLAMQRRGRSTVPMHLVCSCCQPTPLTARLSQKRQDGMTITWGDSPDFCSQKKRLVPDKFSCHQGRAGTCSVSLWQRLLLHISGTHGKKNICFSGFIPE